MLQAVCVLIILLASFQSVAATYSVGSGQAFADLQSLFDSVNLEPGDIVNVQGNQSYTGGVIMRAEDSGSAGNPVTLRGIRVAGQRPILVGGINTIEFRQAQHVVFEGFEVAGTATGIITFRCVYHYSHDLTIRDTLIRDCPRHGILSADELSGDLTVEYTEIRNTGTSADGEHSIYTTSDSNTYPNAVFRLRHSYIHDNNAGNLLKSRARRNEIYYNWFQGADVHALELIGPDPCCQPAGWNPDLIREDSDVVANVLVHSKATHFAMIRVGGDGTGESKGRYRFVNNTLLWTATGVATPVAWRAHFGIEAIEMHNNIVHRSGGGAFTILREESPTQWLSGRRVIGRNNVLSPGASAPIEWLSTITASSASAIGFVNEASFDLNYQPTRLR